MPMSKQISTWNYPINGTGLYSEMFFFDRCQVLFVNIKFGDSGLHLTGVVAWARPLILTGPRPSGDNGVCHSHSLHSSRNW